MLMVIYVDRAFEALKKRKDRKIQVKKYLSGSHNKCSRASETDDNDCQHDALLALVPILGSHGTGSQVWKRIAAPMAGGLVISTILTLVVIPVIYAIIKEFILKKQFK